VAAPTSPATDTNASMRATSVTTMTRLCGSVSGPTSSPNYGNREP
jgi:hypothetical protein